MKYYLHYFHKLQTTAHIIANILLWTTSSFLPFLQTTVFSLDIQKSIIHVLIWIHHLHSTEGHLLLPRTKRQVLDIHTTVCLWIGCVLTAHIFFAGDLCLISSSSARSSHTMHRNWTWRTHDLVKEMSLEFHVIGVQNAVQLRASIQFVLPRHLHDPSSIGHAFQTCRSRATTTFLLRRVQLSVVSARIRMVRNLIS